jgi:hypothetical protein
MRDYCIREANQVTCCWAYGPDTMKDAMNYELGRKHVESMRSDCVNWLGLKETARNQATCISCTDSVSSIVQARNCRMSGELNKNLHILHRQCIIHCSREKLQNATRTEQEPAYLACRHVPSSVYARNCRMPREHTRASVSCRYRQCEVHCLRKTKLQRTITTYDSLHMYISWIHTV